MFKIILPLLFLLFCTRFSYSQERITTVLQDGWKFCPGENPAAMLTSFDDSHWQSVTIPHDWAIAGPFIADGDGNTGKLPWKGEGWYRRKLDIPAPHKEKRIYLLFDGIMAFPSVYLNGQLVGGWDYGYNSFYLDITDHVDFDDENVLAVHADTRQHDSRWYPGGGIYRKIRMIVVDPVHVAIWGTYITTPIIKPHYADVRVAATLNNCTETAADVEIEHIIFSAQREVAKARATAKIAAQQGKMIETTLTVVNPTRWDVDNPHLYTLITTIYRHDQPVDSYTSTFGVREMRFTPDHGFYLNDRHVQFKGVCLHHDHGPLGAAFYRRAMQRQLEIMKEMGCNAIRTSHNTAAPEVLELCDEMGLLVLNEVFDKYDAKADIVDTTDFDDFAQRNIRNFVVRDRNHPSVFLWSVGNEIGDVQWNKDNGFYKLQTMVNFVKKYDPTRPTTLVCDSYESAALRHFDYYDVHCWNYGRRYSLARQLEPNKSVIISESASTVSTRGFYELPLPDDKTDFTNSLQVSSYDLHAPQWAEVADDDFMWQQEEPYIAGEFVWTGFDYLGEPTPYNNFWLRRLGPPDAQASRSSYFGIVDLCGIPKDRYYLYKSYWRPQATTVHILPHWNWPDRIGQNVPVFVYTNGDCAELFLNDRSLGRRCKEPKSAKSIERFRLMWSDVAYEPGTLKAIAYRVGEKIGESILKTASEPVALRLTPDRTTLQPDGADLSYILIEAMDRDGNLCPLADNKIDIELTGAGRIAGMGNGNPQSLNGFQSSSVNLFYGKAMVIIQSASRAGRAMIKATSDGLKGDSVSIETD
ncbi:DUF4982 domain-containing protein [candidate division KSB1 bacterium]|nr:DUF4982 domain-containing protein [candidate division KSB1 bacterium]RQW03413.1 MAG: DUF4982 domain-containing protein [candidate division KSB1 bacterium]